MHHYSSAVAIISSFHPDPLSQLCLNWAGESEETQGLPSKTKDRRLLRVATSVLKKKQKSEMGKKSCVTVDVTVASFKKKQKTSILETIINQLQSNSDTVNTI